MLTGYGRWSLGDGINSINNSREITQDCEKQAYPELNLQKQTDPIFQYGKLEKKNLQTKNHSASSETWSNPAAIFEEDAERRQEYGQEDVYAGGGAFFHFLKRGFKWSTNKYEEEILNSEVNYL